MLHCGCVAKWSLNSKRQIEFTSYKCIFILFDLRYAKHAKDWNGHWLLSVLRGTQM